VDTITHGIAGALLGKAFFFEREGRLGVLAVTVGSVFPDSDAFANLFYHDRIAYLEIHRSITHSFVALPGFALALGAVTCLLARRHSGFPTEAEFVGAGYPGSPADAESVGVGNPGPQSGPSESESISAHQAQSRAANSDAAIPNRWWRWLLLSCLFGIGIGLHIVMDLITSFGTMIWSPLTRARISWDMTFIMDLLLTTIVLLPQLAAWAYSDPQRTRRRCFGIWFCMTAAVAAIARLAGQFQVPISATSVATGSAVIAAVLWIPSAGGRGFHWKRSAYCRVGVAALVIYLGLCQIAHRAALVRVKDFASRSGIAVERLAALPSPPSVLRWSGLVETPKGIYRGSINLANSSEPAYLFFPNAENNWYLQRAETQADVKTYLWFARFPWVTYYETEGLHVVEFKDIQFFFPPRGNDPPFTLRVFFDAQGHILNSTLLDR